MPFNIEQADLASLVASLGVLDFVLAADGDCVALGDSRASVDSCVLVGDGFSVGLDVGVGFGVVEPTLGAEAVGCTVAVDGDAGELVVAVALAIEEAATVVGVAIGEVAAGVVLA